MAITIMPRDINPWVRALPSFLQNMALQKMSQRFRGQLIEQEREIRKAERKENRQWDVGDIESNRGYATGERVAGEEFQLNKDPSVQQVGGNVGIPENTSKVFAHNGKIYAKTVAPEKVEKDKYNAPVKGKDFYWHYKNGDFYKTKIPVAKAEGAKTGDGGIPKSAKELRGEFTKQSKVFIDVRNAYNRVEASAKDPSPAGDLSMIFNYMKILDPESVVREGEFATAANSGSVPSRIRAQYNKVMRGERLDAKMRADFLNRSQQLYKRQILTHKQLRGEYSRLSKRYGVDPALTIVDYLAPKVSADAPTKLTPAHKTEAQRLRKRYGLEDTN